MSDGLFKDDENLVRLAAIVRVESYKRKSKTGNTERVSAYIRKNLGSFNGTSTKVGVHRSLFDEPIVTRQKSDTSSPWDALLDPPEVTKSVQQDRPKWLKDDAKFEVLQTEEGPFVIFPSGERSLGAAPWEGTQYEEGGEVFPKRGGSVSKAYLYDEIDNLDVSGRYMRLGIGQALMDQAKKTWPDARISERAAAALAEDNKPKYRTQSKIPLDQRRGIEVFGTDVEHDGNERQVYNPRAHGKNDAEFGTPESEGPAVWAMQEEGPAPFKSMRRFEGRTEPIEFVYRGMSLEEWEQAEKRGYIQSDRRGVIADWEGTNAGVDLATAMSYVPRNNETVIVKIAVKPEDKWFTISADGYPRTREKIPLDRVVARTDPLMTGDTGEILSPPRKTDTLPEVTKRVSDLVESLRGPEITRSVTTLERPVATREELAAGFRRKSSSGAKVSTFSVPETQAWLVRHPVDSQNIVDMFEKATPGERNSGRDWYPDAHKIAQEMGKAYGVSTREAAGMIAAYSPQTPWGRNLMEANEVLRTKQPVGGPGAHLSIIRTPDEEEESRYGVMASGVNRKRAAALLAGKDFQDVFAGKRNKSGDLPPNALKIRAFAELIARGEQDPDETVPHVVIDRHAAGVARGVRFTADDYNIDAPSGSKKKYEVYATAYREAAAMLSRREGRTVTPEEVQATTWLARQRLNVEDISARRKLGRRDIDDSLNYFASYLPTVAEVMSDPMVGYAELSDDKKIREAAEGLKAAAELGVAARLATPEKPVLTRSVQKTLPGGWKPYKPPTDTLYQQRNPPLAAYRMPGATVAIRNADLSPGERDRFLTEVAAVIGRANLPYEVRFEVPAKAAMSGRGHTAGGSTRTADGLIEIPYSSISDKAQPFLNDPEQSNTHMAAKVGQGLRYYIAHELGHVVDIHQEDTAGNARAENTFWRSQTDGLSGYGKEIPDLVGDSHTRAEGYAEAYAQWLLRGTVSSDDDPVVQRQNATADAYAARYGWNTDGRMPTKATPAPKKKRAAPKAKPKDPTANMSLRELMEYERKKRQEREAPPVITRSVQEQKPKKVNVPVTEKHQPAGRGVTDWWLVGPDTEDLAQRQGEYITYYDAGDDHFRIYTSTPTPNPDPTKPPFKDLERKTVASVRKPDGTYKVIGYMMWERDGTVHAVLVDPPYRRLGVAAKMRDWAREKGATLKHSHALSPSGRAWAESDKAETPPVITRSVTEKPTFSFETETCSRCGGTGTMPYTNWAGKCFKCSGSGKMLTSAGRSARKRYDTFLDSQPEVSVSDLKVGDRFRIKGTATGWQTVTSEPVPDPLNEGVLKIGTTGGQAGPFGIGRASGINMPGSWSVQLHPGAEAIRGALSKKNGSFYAGVVVGGQKPETPPEITRSRNALALDMLSGGAAPGAPLRRPTRAPLRPRSPLPAPSTPDPATLAWASWLEENVARLDGPPREEFLAAVSAQARKPIGQPYLDWTQPNRMPTDFPALLGMLNLSETTRARILAAWRSRRDVPPRVRALLDANVAASAPDDGMVALAKVSRVQAHRRVSAFGNVEQVDSYVRKTLDPYGPGANAKTRAGAYAAKTRVRQTPVPPAQRKGVGGRHGAHHGTLTTADVVREIEARGGVETSQRGSHRRYEFTYPGGKVWTVVPMHNRDVPKGTLRSIEKDLEPVLGERWMSE